MGIGNWNEASEHIPTVANVYSGTGSVLLRTAKATVWRREKTKKYKAAGAGISIVRRTFENR
jgi:hypothetical protein